MRSDHMNARGEMSKKVSKAVIRAMAFAPRASAKRIAQLTDRDIVTKWVGRLAGRNVGRGPDYFHATRTEAVQEAREIRTELREQLT